MFEDATVLRDPEELGALSYPGGVDPAGCDCQRVVGGIVRLLAERRDSPAYIALPPHILQRGATALVLAGFRLCASRAVAPQGWRYLISSLGG